MSTASHLERGRLRRLISVSQFGDSFTRASATIHFQRAEELYGRWPSPICILSDGPYGLSGFPGDPPTVQTLVDWYRPHVVAWSERSTPETTLWFWNSELGWATVHPLLLAHGWEYRCCHVWDKGIGHVAGQLQHRNPAKTASCHRGLCAVCETSALLCRRPDHVDAGMVKARMAAIWSSASPSE